MDLTFAECSITDIDVQINLEGIRSSANDWLTIYNGDAATGAELVRVSPGFGGQNDLHVNDIDIDSTQITFEFSQAISNPSCPHPASEMKIIEVSISGHGFNPWA